MTFDYYGIFGFDISTYQDSDLISGTVDFAKMRAYGARFVIFRASIGNAEDADYKKYVENSRGIIPFSAYHFYHPNVDTKVQAARFWNTIKSRPPQMVWLDCETGGTNTWRGWYDFIEEFKRLSGFTDNRIGIYTGFYVWTEITTYATLSQKAYFGKFPLWLAWYTDDPFRPVYTTIRIPYPWDKITILQSGTPAIGKLAGVESMEIDYNQFNGDESSFRSFFNLTDEPLPPVTKTQKCKIVVYQDGSTEEL